MDHFVGSLDDISIKIAKPDRVSNAALFIAEKDITQSLSKRFATLTTFLNKYLVCVEFLLEVPHPVPSVATYEGRDRGVNPISVVTECDWHSKGCGRLVTADSHADPEG